MRFALRSPLATLVLLLLLVPVAAITGGCSSATEVEDGGPTVTATGPKETSDAPSDEVETSAPTEPSTPTDVPDSVAAVCGPYIEMSRAIKSAGFGGADPDELADAIAPVMKEFAARVPTLERPPGVSAATWRGVEALAERILALPDHPTYADVEAVEDELTEQEWDAVLAARDWLRDNCHL